MAWYESHRRDLPWRRTHDPYAIWLSEMMLQQTQVATVIPYYDRFLTRFPTVQALAAAPLGEVLKRWAGLGYYARARYLHRAAKLVVNEFAGRFPDTVGGLRRLPGVGPYTSGAIASIAFNRRAAVVDGNVARVLTRLANLRVDVVVSVGRMRVWQIAESLLPQRRCGDFNQALMELGATICLPGQAARCNECPLQKDCSALAAGTVPRLPFKKKKTPVHRERYVVAAIRRNGRFLAVRRPPKGLWGGLWELPSAVLDGQPSADGAREIARRLIDVPCVVARRPFCRLTRQLTHRTIQFVGHVCRITNWTDDVRAAPLPSKSPDRQPSKWVKLDDIERLGISQAMKDVLAHLRQWVLARRQRRVRSMVFVRRGEAQGALRIRPAGLP